MSMQANSMKSRDDAYVSVDPLSRTRLAYHTVGESKTRQADKQAADINAIVDRFNRTGQLPPAKTQPMYADVTGLQGDLTESVNKSREVQTEYVESVKKARRKKADAAKTAAKADSKGDQSTIDLTPPAS